MPSLQLAAEESRACDHIFTVGAELALYGPSQKGQHIRRPARGFLQRSPVSSLLIILSETLAVSCNYMLSSPTVWVVLWTLQNRITVCLGLIGFFVSSKRRKYQFSNTVYQVIEGPDDLPQTGPRPAFLPYNHFLLFSICNCKKMTPDFHIVLPSNERSSNSLNSRNRSHL